MISQNRKKRIKRKIWKRDNYICQYCFKDLSSSMITEFKRLPHGDITVDHIIPLIKGGTWRMYNLVTACRKCNGSKGGRILQGSIFELLEQNKTPDTPPLAPVFYSMQPSTEFKKLSNA